MLPVSRPPSVSTAPIPIASPARPRSVAIVASSYPYGSLCSSQPCPDSAHISITMAVSPVCETFTTLLAELTLQLARSLATYVPAVTPVIRQERAQQDRAVTAPASNTACWLRSDPFQLRKPIKVMLVDGAWDEKSNCPYTTTVAFDPVTTTDTVAPGTSASVVKLARLLLETVRPLFLAAP